MILAGFITAILAHVLYKWLGWYSKHRDNTLMGYWREFGVQVLGGFGFDALIYILFDFGWLLPLARWGAAKYGIEIPADLPMPDAARRAVQLEGGLLLGLFAESFGKTFFPALGRLWTASIRKLIGALPKEED